MRLYEPCSVVSRRPTQLSRGRHQMSQKCSIQLQNLAGDSPNRELVRKGETMMLRWRPFLFSVLVLSGNASRGAAQELGSVIGGVLGKVTDLDAGYFKGRPITIGTLRSSPLSGLAFEATLDLGSFNCRRQCPPEPAKVTKKPTVPGQAAPKDTTTRKDTTLTQFQVQVRDTMFTYLVAKKPASVEPAPEYTFGVELGIGYSQTKGFRGDSGLRGSLEEKPFVSVYVTVIPWVLKPYAGVRGGLTQLKDFRAVVNDSSLSASGSTFEYGGVLGLAVGPAKGTWALFAEFSVTGRSFEGVDWSRQPPVGRLRDPLDLSTYAWTFGGQFRFDSKKP